MESSPFYIPEGEWTPIEELLSPENLDHELDPQISPTPKSYQGVDADYSPSTPIYDEEEIERFERMEISMRTPENSISEESPEI